MPDDNNSVPFTNKEMWVRVDAKLDTLVSRQQHFDVELALLKERQHQAEVALAAHHSEEVTARDLIAKNLAASEEKMEKEVQTIKDGQTNVGRLIKYATAAIIAAGIVADGLIRFYR